MIFVSFLCGTFLFVQRYFRRKKLRTVDYHKKAKRKWSYSIISEPRRQEIILPYLTLNIVVYLKYHKNEQLYNFILANKTIIIWNEIYLESRICMEKATKYLLRKIMYVKDAKKCMNPFYCRSYWYLFSPFQSFYVTLSIYDQ